MSYGKCRLWTLCEDSTALLRGGRVAIGVQFWWLTFILANGYIHKNSHEWTSGSEKSSAIYRTQALVQP